MTELKPFQREGVRQIYTFGGRALLCDEMGLGKTIQALDWIRRIPKRRPVIIVVPASVKFAWQHEAMIHFGIRIDVIEGRMPARTKRLPGEIVVLNYELLQSWLPVLRAADPAVVIFDEAHYLKNTAAQRTKSAARLVQSAESVLALSGTPLTNRPIELWPVMRLVRPDIFPSRELYAWRYCKPRWTFWGWQYDGATHLDELHRILKENCMIRRLKKDVLKELPAKTRQVVPFRLKSMVEYNKAQHTFLEWLREISPAKAQRASKSQALTKVGYLLRLVARLKLDWTEQWLKEFFEAHPGEKLVALTMHTFVIDHLKERFPKSVIIDGRITGRIRHESVRKFQNNSQVPLLLGNWKAAGVGITLHAAHNVVALDLPWTPGDLLQGEDRVHRIGQKKGVIVHYLTALNTIEEKLVKILRKKASILDAVLDGRADSTDFNLFDALLENMIKE